ncbi:hypothetical protein B0H19DRAFT_1071557 [Mycena capillaripes]|nr:hypothetical protein B0H19DRAFT_1071557 [Mycena capillaripes]
MWDLLLDFISSLVKALLVLSCFLPARCNGIFTTPPNFLLVLTCWGSPPWTSRKIERAWVRQNSKEVKTAPTLAQAALHPTRSSRQGACMLRLSAVDMCNATSIRSSIPRFQHLVSRTNRRANPSDFGQAHHSFGYSVHLHGVPRDITHKTSLPLPLSIGARKYPVYSDMMIPILAKDIPLEKQLSDLRKLMINAIIRTKTSSWARSIRQAESLELKDSGLNSHALISEVDLESQITYSFANYPHTRDALQNLRLLTKQKWEQAVGEAMGAGGVTILVLGVVGAMEDALRKLWILTERKWERAEGEGAGANVIRVLGVERRRGGAGGAGGPVSPIINHSGAAILVPVGMEGVGGAGEGGGEGESTYININRSGGADGASILLSGLAGGMGEAGETGGAGGAGGSVYININCSRGAGGAAILLSGVAGGMGGVGGWEEWGEREGRCLST